MPTRLIREGIITSKPVAALVNDASWFGEVFYRRLHQLVDDFGRYTADPTLLRAAMFPLHIDKVREADCARLLAACEKAGLIRLYAVKGERYLEVLKFDQRTRAKRSKFPAPADTCPSHDGHMPVTCPSHAPGDGDGDGDGDVKYCPEPQAASGPSPAPLRFPVKANKGNPWDFTTDHLDSLASAFPGIDILAEARKALAWCEANPAKQKTARGIAAFLHRWVGRANDSGRAAKVDDTPDIFAASRQEVSVEEARRILGHGEAA